MQGLKKIGLVALVALVIGFTFMAFPAQAGNLKPVNKSASEIHAIYISDSGAEDWEENLIEGYLLPPGNDLTIQIHGSYHQFDLLVEDDMGNDEDYRNFPGSTTMITIKGDGESEYR